MSVMWMASLIAADDSAADSAAASPAAPWPTTIRCLVPFVIKWGAKFRSLHEIAPFGTGTLLHRGQPRLVVSFIDDLGWQHDLFRQSLAFDLTNCGARRHASNLEHIEVDGSENLAGFDLFHGWKDTVDTYDCGRSVRFLYCLEHAKGHAVICREHAV